MDFEESRRGGGAAAESTSRLAERLAPRCALSDIEIALVGSRSEVMDVKPDRGNVRATGRSNG